MTSVIRASLALLLAVATASLPRPHWTPSQGSERDVLMVAWAPHGLPHKAKRAVARIDGVEATTIVAGTMWLKRSSARGGRVVDDPPGDQAIPVEVAFVTPAQFRAFVPQTHRETVDGLGRKQALMPAAEARLRGGHEQLDVRLGRYTRSVIATVPNEVTLGYEFLMAGPPPDTFDRKLRFVLVRARADVDPARIKKRIQGLLEPGEPLRLKRADQVSYLRYADSVHPLFVFKREFGEFTAAPSREGTIAIDPGWVERRIQTARVPILGNVRCHEELFPPLRKALREVREEGLAGHIDPDQYAGCFNPRFVATVPGTRISRHTWGIALDLNARDNPFGAEPRMDERVVRIFERWGFLWGGRWPLPDGMHFEWTRPPERAGE